MIDFSKNIIPEAATFRNPKLIARIKVCGSININVYDTTEGFIKPTPEQIKNLKEMLCIDVELLEGATDNG